MHTLPAQRQDLCAGSTVDGRGPADAVQGVERQLVLGMQLARSKVGPPQMCLIDLLIVTQQLPGVPD